MSAPAFLRPFRHVVWDWNGTLLDDFAITARLTIAGLAELGRLDVTEEAVRAAYRRPLAACFSDLLGRPAEQADLAVLGRRYAEGYSLAMFDLPLAKGARSVLVQVGAQASQSLLSMAPDGEVQTLIDHHGLRHHFARVEGFRGTGHPGKVDSLLAHCAALGCEPCDICLIGDTCDDFDAAAATGASVVLVATGMQAHACLERTGAAVAADLTAVADLLAQFALSRQETRYGT